MDIVHSYALYRGYYIYVPHEDDYIRDVLGNYLVHARIENQETRLVETIPVRGAVAATFLAAREESVRQGIRIVEDRIGPPLAAPASGFRERDPPK